MKVNFNDKNVINENISILDMEDTNLDMKAYKENNSSLLNNKGKFEIKNGKTYYWNSIVTSKYQRITIYEDVSLEEIDIDNLNTKQIDNVDLGQDIFDLIAEKSNINNILQSNNKNADYTVIDNQADVTNLDFSYLADEFITNSQVNTIIDVNNEYDDEEDNEDEINNDEDDSDDDTVVEEVTMEDNSIIDILSHIETLNELDNVYRDNKEEFIDSQERKIVYDWIKSTKSTKIDSNGKKTRIGIVKYFGNGEIRKQIEEILLTIGGYNNENVELTTVNPLPLSSDIYNFKRSVTKNNITVDTIFSMELQIIGRVITSRNYKLSVEKTFESMSPWKDKEIDGINYRQVNLKLKNRKYQEIYKNNCLKLINIPPVSIFKKTMNMGYVERSNYRILRTTEELKEFKNFVDTELGKDHILGYDAETTGLKFYKFIDDSKRDKLVSHSISWGPGQAVIIPLRMLTTENAKQEDVNKYIKPILERNPIVAHNGAADVLFNMNDNKEDQIDLNLVEDTFLLIKELLGYLSEDETSGGKNKSRSKIKKSLEYLVKLAFNKDMINLKKQVFGPQNADFDFSRLPEEYLIWYGCPDVDLCRQLLFLLRPKLEKVQEEGYLQRVVLSKIGSELATWAGFKFDPEVFDVVRKHKIKDLKRIADLFYTLAGETPNTLNINSPAQLVNFVYSKLGVPITTETRKGKSGYSTDKKALEKITEIATANTGLFKEELLDYEGEFFKVGKKDATLEYLNTRKYPSIAILLIYRSISKEIGFFDGFIEESFNNIYNPHYNIGALATYRTSEKRAQTLKGNLKNGIIPYNDDWYYCCCDVRSQELVIATNLSPDDDLINKIKEPEVDLHTLTASEIFMKEMYEVSKDERSMAKTFNFGILYRMSLYTLIKNAEKVEKVTPELIEKYKPKYENFLVRYDGMLSAIGRLTKKALTTGVIYNLVGFRMIYDIVVDINDLEAKIFDPTVTEPPKIKTDPYLFSQYGNMLYTKMGNYPIQSVAASEFQRSMITLYRKLRQYNLIDKIFIPLWVHDEMNLIIHKSVDPRLVMKLLKESWETDFKYMAKNTCKQYIGIGFGNNWKEAKSDDNELPVRLQNRIVKEYIDGKQIDFYKGYEGKPASNAMTDYFSNRIRDYIIERFFNLVAPKLVNGELKTGEIVDLLARNQFELKNIGSLVNILKDSKDVKSIIPEKIIEALKMDNRYNKVFKKDPEVVITRPTIFDKPPEEFNMISFRLKPVFHRNILLTNNSITVNIPINTDKAVVENIKKYFNHYKSSLKTSIPVFIQKGTKKEPLVYNGQEILVDGIGINGREHLDRIFNGEDLDTMLKTRKERIKLSIGLYDILKISSNKIILDVTDIEDEYKQLVIDKIIETMKPILEFNKKRQEYKDIEIKNNDCSNIINNVVKGRIDFTLQKKLADMLNNIEIEEVR